MKGAKRQVIDFWKQFDPPFGAFGRWAPDGPKADVTETESALEISIELPGIDRKEIDVSLTNNAVTVCGHRLKLRSALKRQSHAERLADLTGPGPLELDRLFLIIVSHRPQDLGVHGHFVGQAAAPSRLLAQGLNLSQIGRVDQHIDGAG